MLIKLAFILVNLFLVQISLSENVTNETSHDTTNEIGYNVTEESTDNDTEIRYEDLGRQLRPAPRVCSCLRWTAWGSYGSPRTMDWSFLRTLRYSKDTLKSKATEYGQNSYEDICETHLSVGCRILSKERHDYDYSTQYSACPIYTYRSAPNGGLVQLRFLCPDYHCPCLAWSDWYDYDNPDGEGDIETLLGTIPKKQWPCVNGERPLDVDCRTLSGKRISETNNKAVTCDLNGLKCYNRDQGPRCTCEDYKVRFLCFRGQMEHGEVAGYSDRYPPPRKPYLPQPQPPRHYPEEEEIIGEDIVVPVDEQSYKHDDEYPEPPQEPYPPYKRPEVHHPPRPGDDEYQGEPDYIDLDDDKSYEPRPLYPPHEPPRIYRNPDYEDEHEDYKYPKRPGPQVPAEDDDEGCHSREYSCRKQKPRRPVQVPTRRIEHRGEHEYEPPGERHGHIGGKDKEHGRKEGHSKRPGTRPRKPEYPRRTEDEDHEYEYPDGESTDTRPDHGGHYSDKNEGHGRKEGDSQHHGTRPRQPSYPPRKEHKPPHPKTTLIGADTDVISGKPKPRGPTGEVVDADVKVIDEDSLGGILGHKRKGKEEHGRHNGHKQYPDRGEHGSHGEGQHSKAYGNPHPEGHEKNPGLVDSAYNPDTVPHSGSHHEDQLVRKDGKTLVGADVDAITGEDGPEGPDGEVVDADVAALGEGDGPLDSLLKGESDKNGGSEGYENPDGEYVPPSEKVDEILGGLPVGEYENPPSEAYEVDELDVSQPEANPDILPPTGIDDKLPSKDSLPVKPETLIGADVDAIGGGGDESKRPTGEVIDADVAALDKGGPLAGILHGGKDQEGKPSPSNGQYDPNPAAEDVKRIPPASIPDVYGTNPGESGLLGGSSEDSYKESPVQGESVPDVPVVGKDKGVAADVISLTTKDEKEDYGSITDVDVGVSSLADPSGKRKKAPVAGLLGRSGASEAGQLEEDSMDDEQLAKMLMPKTPSKDDCWMKKLIYSIFAAKSPTRGTEHLHKLQFRDDCPDDYDV